MAFIDAYIRHVVTVHTETRQNLVQYIRKELQSGKVAIDDVVLVMDLTVFPRENSARRLTAEEQQDEKQTDGSTKYLPIEWWAMWAPVAAGEGPSKARVLSYIEMFDELLSD